jgi:hypothetical protein
VFLDPKLLTVDMGEGTNLVLANTEAGRGFHLRSVPLAPGERVTKNAFESFAVGYVKSAHVKQLSASRLTFKGLPSYQFDPAFPDGKGVAVRLLHANQQLYVLQALSVEAPVDPKEAESIFQGFNFIGTPEPVALTETDVDNMAERGRLAGQGCVTLMLLVGVEVAVYFVARSRRKPAARPG